jgi:hypothetical protein
MMSAFSTNAANLASACGIALVSMAAGLGKAGGREKKLQLEPAMMSAIKPACRKK